ncbi:exported hypothetical protein [Rhizobium mesoamericanum STM3625]|uniref:Transmembrane protein n=1 Tax=Rhizobium mesoamericanum STM3625 TaxID=1211777 RepID=K0PYA6_9HYPH|nr:exported hypothetical protein [Rhizobium mesoamericanum STM3625]
MFVEDEFVVRRLRVSRVTITLLVAFFSFAASILMTLGLVTTVYAEDGQSRHMFVQLAASHTAAAPTATAAEVIAQTSTSMKWPQTATRADDQILRGIVTLLAALTAASGLAVWRRRVRGIFAGTVYDAR